MESKEQTQSQPSQNTPTDFWSIAPKKTKPEIIDLLIDRLGEPKNELEKNCLNAISGKISYYFAEQKDNRGEAVSSMIGQVDEVTLKKFKDGRTKGQTYYSLKLTDKTILRAKKEDLSTDKWTQIEQLAILDQNLLFKYKKWIVYKDIIDFYPV